MNDNLLQMSLNQGKHFKKKFSKIKKGKPIKEGFVSLEQEEVIRPSNQGYVPVFKNMQENTNLTTNMNQTNLNDLETDIEFIIKFPNGGRKNWYKFFTYTYGPSVQTSIVIPVNNNSIEGLKLQCRSDYVAAGIVNVAENLWAEGESLRMVFNNEQEKLLFVKLF